MKIQKFCKLCGKEYYVPPYRKDISFYCSQTCSNKDMKNGHGNRWKGGKVALICKNCGGSYSVYPSQANGSLYCSASCRSKSIDNRGEKSNFWKGGNVKYTCTQCGKMFTDRPGEARQFCSMECHDISRQKRVVGTCKRCGKNFERQKSRAKRYEGEYCSLLCYGLSKFGAGNPNWLGGSSFAPYPATFNAQFKRMIRERDNYTCAVCKKSGNHVHHINYVKMDTTPENCVTLCQPCHMRTNGNRSYWIEWFTSFHEQRRAQK